MQDGSTAIFIFTNLDGTVSVEQICPSPSQIAEGKYKLLKVLSKTPIGLKSISRGGVFETK